MPDFICADWLEGKIYPARIVNRWNGWAVPIVTKATAEQIVADMNATRDPSDEDSDVLTWDGATIVRHQPAYADEADYTPERTDADDDGNYCISFDWCWSSCTADGEWS